MTDDSYLLPELNPAEARRVISARTRTADEPDTWKLLPMSCCIKLKAYQYCLTRRSNLEEVTQMRAFSTAMYPGSKFSANSDPFESAWGYTGDTQSGGQKCVFLTTASFDAAKTSVSSASDSNSRSKQSTIKAVIIEIEKTSRIIKADDLFFYRRPSVRK